MPYVSDDQVIINVQGLRTVQIDEWGQYVEKPHRLMWAYKGQEHSHSYADQAARDAMYEKLRKALTAEREQKKRDSSDSGAPTRSGAAGLDIIRRDSGRPGGQGDAV